MATKCPTCRSADTQTSIGDRNQCLHCGALFDSKGDAVERGPDQTTREVMEARLRPRQDTLSGNLADLQRFGAAKAPDPKAHEFVLPEGVDTDRLPDGEARSAADVVAKASAPAEGDGSEVSGRRSK